MKLYQLSIHTSRRAASVWFIDLFRLWLSSGFTGAWWMFARFGVLGWIALAVMSQGRCAWSGCASIAPRRLA